jgi:TonB family protein
VNSLLHALNIGTLANWLSMLLFGTVAVIAPEWQKPAHAVSQDEEVRVVTEDFTLGDVMSSEPQSLAANSAPSEVPHITAEAIPLPAPPELPEIDEFSPLPEIPNLPAAASQPAIRPSAKPSPSRSSTAKPSAAPRSGPVGRPTAGSSAGAPASGASNAARLAQGRMPQPNYPAAARRANQTGTVVVEFTVDESGRVISAYAKSPSPWPLLNNEAVRTVRGWRFPPGGVMKLQRPIVFQLR